MDKAAAAPTSYASQIEDIDDCERPGATLGKGCGLNDDDQIIQQGPGWPVVVHPGPASMEDLLGSIDPASDAETERFVAGICRPARGSNGLKRV